ncbi:hypothetical protein ACFOLJ_23425 [Rugamonas sp. CCM 8940]|uniref:hypothetical protein n=1 Tax=Rugamonas sp. CCM 8940 TaxID=2765359 RepID=UPI0018F6AD08|nr:hypothetical protein [Rugamonas sp. CCM 8940]MBJ7311974.1 hypothetical protein [Rugamonas sp. CCM 8940]
MIGISARRIRLLVVVSGAHAALTAILWFWSLGGALGLGFKDKGTWSLFDHFQADVIPTLAKILATPGRFIMSDKSDILMSITIPWLANSVLWGAGIVLVFELLMYRQSKGGM